MTRGHGSDGAVETQIQDTCLISKEYEDRDCLRYVKRLKREGDSLFTFIMNDVEYHNNVSERALRRFAEFRKSCTGTGPAGAQEPNP